MISTLAHAARVGTGFLLLALASGGAGAQAPDAVSKLKREGQITCRPSVPYFCANMHVTCAGMTSVATFPFTLHITPSGSALRAPPSAKAFAEAYAGGNVEWSNEGRYVILHPARSSGYIKLFRDGTYVFRHYPHHEGVMSLGTCA